MVLGQYLIAGLTTASIYALISLGVTMMYGVARVLNVANAMMFGLSAFLTLELVERGVPYPVAALIAIIAVVAFGMVTYILFFQWQLDRPFSAMVISLGLVVVLQAVMIAIWGLEIYRIPTGLSQTFTIGEVAIVKGALLTIGVTIVVTAALFYVLKTTSLGRAMRAVQEDPETAVLLGIKSRRIIMSTFAIGTALAAVGGVLAGTFLPFTGDSATSYGVKTFAIAIVGGLGRPVGAVVASVLLAAAETIPAAMGLASWSPAFLYSALVVILLVRPQGLFASFGHSAGHSAEESSAGAGEGKAVTMDRRRRAIRLAVIVAAATALFIVLAPLIFTNASARSTAAYATIVILLAYSVWLPLRFLGVPSIGHVAIWGAAAYVATIATDRWEIGLFSRFVLAFAVGTVLAFFMAMIALRVQGLVSVAAVTLGLAGLMVNIFQNLDITGGSTGLTFVTPVSVGGVEYAPADTDIILYSIGAVLLAVVIVLFGLLFTHRWGRTMIAVRDAEVLAASLGLNGYWVKVAGFTASGGIAGIAGVLYVHFNRYLDPTLFHDTMAINILLAVIVGGSAYLLGPLVGGLMLAFLPELLPFDGVMNRAVYGMIVVLIATFANGGIMGWAHAAYHRFRRVTGMDRSSRASAESSVQIQEAAHEDKELVR